MISGKIILSVLVLLSLRAAAAVAFDFHGPININSIDKEKTLSELFHRATDFDPAKVQFESWEFGLAAQYAFSGVGKINAYFKVGRCSGASEKSLKDALSASLKNGDVFATAHFGIDYSRRIQCENARKVQCRVYYHSHGENLLRLWMDERACDGKSLSGKVSAAVSLDIYRVDGNNAAFTDVRVRQLSTAPVRP